MDETLQESTTWLLTLQVKGKLCFCFKLLRSQRQSNLGGKKLFMRRLRDMSEMKGGCKGWELRKMLIWKDEKTRDEKFKVKKKFNFFEKGINIFLKKIFWTPVKI